DRDPLPRRRNGESLRRTIHRRRYAGSGRTHEVHLLGLRPLTQRFRNGMKQTAMRTGRLRRSIAPARLAGGAALRWATTYLYRGERRRAKRKQVVLRTAEDVTRTMGEMKGAAMKIGQVLSLMT